MSISSLNLFKVAVPLKKVVKHASFERSVSENLVVRVRLSDGIVGYGEGVPRPYVTGETWNRPSRLWKRTIGSSDHGSAGQLCAGRRADGDLTLPEIESDPRGMSGNAARCALELAILDAYGRRFGESVGRAVELARVDGLERFAEPRRVRYSGGDHRRVARAERISALKMRIYGFHQVKIKVGTQGQDDRPAAGANAEIPGPAHGHPARRQRGVAGCRADRPRASRSCGSVRRRLEQPVPHAEVDRAGRAASATGRSGHARRVTLRLPGRRWRPWQQRTADLLNVRLSKCGGILPSLRIIGLAQRSGLGVQLGCHPGETCAAFGRGTARRQPRRRSSIRGGLVRPAHPGRQPDSTRI